jgi:tetratricopeptide (TPR) repeat protein
VLVAKNDSDSIKDAFDVLQQDGKIAAENLSPLDRRLMAALLIGRANQEDFVAASELIERSLEKLNADILLLAKAYEGQGRVAPAWELLSQLVSQPEARDRDLNEILRFWQAHFVRPGDLERGASQFQGLAAQAYRQLASLPTGRKLVLNWKLREALAAHDGDTLSHDQVMAAWGEALNILKVSNEAISADGDLAFELFHALIEEGQASTACRIVTESNSGLGESQLVVPLIWAFMSTDSKNEGHAVAEQFFAKRLQSASTSTEEKYFSMIGDYFFLQEKYEMAIEFYRNALEEGGRDANVENNLALALMEAEAHRSEAWATLTGAIEKHGESGELLDSKAMLEFIDGQLDMARKSLEKVLSQQPYNAANNLHMAMVLAEQNLQSEAQEYFLRSLALGIRSQWLSPRDRQFLDDFEEANQMLLASP